MSWQQKQIILRPRQRGFHIIDDEILSQLPELANYKVGLLHLFTQHTSASLTINENADPNIGKDIISALNKTIIEHDGWLHDKMDNNAAAHIKSAIIGPSETIPIKDSELLLGTWQDVFLCEFDGPKNRNIIITIIGE